MFRLNCSSNDGSGSGSSNDSSRRLLLSWMLWLLWLLLMC